MIRSQHLSFDSSVETSDVFVATAFKQRATFLIKVVFMIQLVDIQRAEMVTAHFCPVYIALFLVPTKSLSLAFGLQENIFVAIFLYQ